VLGVYAILPFSETSAAALEAARKAVTLDPALAEGYAALGFATLTHGLDWEEAERHLRRAADLNPNYVTGRLWLSFFLGMQGRFEEAMTIARRAVEIAPLTPLVRHTLNWTLYHARHFDEAIASARVLVTSEPEYGLGHLLLALALDRTRRSRRARARSSFWGAAPTRSASTRRSRPARGAGARRGRCSKRFAAWRSRATSRPTCWRWSTRGWARWTARSPSLSARWR
jgi:tetratricopeptide (TPR) repeat protein